MLTFQVSAVPTGSTSITRNQMSQLVKFVLTANGLDHLADDPIAEVTIALLIFSIELEADSSRRIFSHN